MRRVVSCRSGLRAALGHSDASGADDAVEQLVEVGRELLSGVAGPDVQRLGGTLSLLQRGALGKLGGEHERPEHVAQLFDAELVLDRLRAHPVDDDAQRLQTGGEAATDLFDRAQRAIGGCDREQPGLGDHHDAVAGSPGGARQGVQRRGAVDQDEVVVGFDGSERLFELPDVADARMRSVEVDGGRAADENIDRARMNLRPSAGGDRLTDDFLLRVRQDIGDVESSGHLDVHAGGHIGLRIEVDDKSTDAPGEGRRGQAEGHGRLADASLERADAEYVHGLHVTLP